MNQVPYRLMEINTRHLIIPAEYQRRLNPARVKRIVDTFDPYIVNEPKVSQRGGFYYVFDGQHTIAALKTLCNGNDLPILCKVYHGLTPEKEAELFSRQTGESSPLTSGARHRAKVFSGDAASIAFQQATENAGLYLGCDQSVGHYHLNCIKTAFDEYLRLDPVLYGEGLHILLTAWDGKPSSLQADMIKGMMGFVELYYGLYDRSRLIDRLRTVSPSAIHDNARADKTLRGAKRYINQIYRIYNGSRIQNALPMKF